MYVILAAFLSKEQRSHLSRQSGRQAALSWGSSHGRIDKGRRGLFQNMATITQASSKYTYYINLSAHTYVLGNIYIWRMHYTYTDIEPRLNTTYRRSSNAKKYNAYFLLFLLARGRDSSWSQKEHFTVNLRNIDSGDRRKLTQETEAAIAPRHAECGECSTKSTTCTYIGKRCFEEWC